MIDKHIQQTTVIGGDDGPVSIFIAGKSNDYKKPLKNRLKNKIYQLRRKRAEKKFSPERMQKKKRLFMPKRNTAFSRSDKLTGNINAKKNARKKESSTTIDPNY